MNTHIENHVFDKSALVPSSSGSLPVSSVKKTIDRARNLSTESHKWEILAKRDLSHTGT